METVEELKARILARFPGAPVEVVPNPGLSGQHSLLVGAPEARAVAEFLRDAPGLRLDYCSNVTGIDWPPREVAAPPAAPGGAPGPKRQVPGFLEVVYHLYSMELGHGPVVLRQRTADRAEGAPVASLTPVWRSCEFQEREVFDLFGVAFDGHPDLRRLLMWDAFQGHPMRKDYVEPDDYEWEPTPHGDVLEKARRHYPAAGAAEEAKP
jgi:NADH-quinone oxidoreductase subunit C